MKFHRLRKSKTALKQIGVLLRPERSRLGWLIATILASSLLELAPPLLMQRLVDVHLIPGINTGLWVLAGIYLGSVALGYAMGYASSYLTARLAQYTLHRLRVRLFSHLQRLPLGYFDRNPVGDLISRCTSDVDTLDTLFSSGVARLITDLTRLVTLAGAMLVLSPPLFLILVTATPVLLWVTARFRAQIRDAERENRAAIGNLNSHLQETLGGVETIQAFGRQTAFLARFRSLLGNALNAYNRSAHYSAVYSPLMQTLTGGVIAFVLWGSSGAFFTSLQISLGTLTAFVLLLKRFFEPVIAVGEELQAVQTAISAAERIFQVLEQPAEKPAVLSPKRRKSLETKSGVVLEQVTFGYGSARSVVQNINLTINLGEHVAIVGRTGSGKSSILNLVSGLYRPWQGQVWLAGLDPHQMGAGERRRLLGVVPQSVQLFSGTVWENLTLGDPEVTTEAVDQAIKLSGAESLVRSLPDGYNTLIQPGNGCGIRLSLGQRQLLSLARALVWNPAVLLFDEATAGIDSRQEAVFRAALQANSIRKQHAILTVAHRLAPVYSADRVIVLDHGRIVEEGPPAELAHLGGQFTALLEQERMGWIVPQTTQGRASKPSYN